ncbi:uncharacterized protein PG998_004540 [Apiospora kogelbergensis]|uniref:uncharacterized protein n=1 Tax=Apiospora kogelbergensis TaxID=1337665 RepID=UPI00312F550D
MLPVIPINAVQAWDWDSEPEPFGHVRKDSGRTCNARGSYCTLFGGSAGAGAVTVRTDERFFEHTGGPDWAHELAGSFRVEFHLRALDSGGGVGASEAIKTDILVTRNRGDQVTSAL